MFYRNFLIALSCLLLTTPLFSQTPNLTDADIAHIGVTANQIDIDYATLAKKKSSNKEVIRFADQMSTDHSAIIKQAVALVTKLGVTPTDNDVSKSLQKPATAKLKELSKLKGSAFDKAYLENEVAYHKAVIGAVKTVLIPSSKNQELKDFLTSLVAPLETHLEHAEMAYAKVK